MALNPNAHYCNCFTNCQLPITFFNFYCIGVVSISCSFVVIAFLASGGLYIFFYLYHQNRNHSKSQIAVNFKKFIPLTKPQHICCNVIFPFCFLRSFMHSQIFESQPVLDHISQKVVHSRVLSACREGSKWNILNNGIESRYDKQVSLTTCSDWQWLSCCVLRKIPVLATKIPVTNQSNLSGC